MAKVIKLLTFDVTGTLLKLQPPVAVKYRQSAEHFGIKVDVNSLMENYKIQWEELSASHPNFGRDSGLGWRAWWEKLVVCSFTATLPNVDQKRLRELARYLIEEYNSSRVWAVSEGAETLLSSVRTYNVVLGIISNFDGRLETILKETHIHKYFDFIITSYDAGILKPEKQIFNYALDKVKHRNISSHNCMHVGDNYKVDYVGALNAGWDAAIIDPTLQKVTAPCDQLNAFENLNQFSNYIVSRIR